MTKAGKKLIEAARQARNNVLAVQLGGKPGDVPTFISGYINEKEIKELLEEHSKPNP